MPSGTDERLRTVAFGRSPSVCFLGLSVHLLVKPSNQLGTVKPDLWTGPRTEHPEPKVCVPTYVPVQYALWFGLAFGI